ncbi:MAG: tyrosine-type recombinase/integrase [Candidatus Phlomobacter fragariae]
MSSGLLFELIDVTDYNLRNALIIKLSLLFGYRVGELLRAKVNDFDFSKGLWIVLSENHKTGRKSKKCIIRPIISVAEKLIKAARQLSNGSEYSFTVSGGKLLRINEHNGFILI